LFFFVVLTWVMFRADSVSAAFKFYEAMFWLKSGPREHESFIAFLEGSRVALAMGIGLLSLVSFRSLAATAYEDHRWNARKSLAGLAMLLLSIVTLVSETFNPFIYYRF
jgi:alginate O-acetyltransferase complex protein AlgI